MEKIIIILITITSILIYSCEKENTDLKEQMEVKDEKTNNKIITVYDSLRLNSIVLKVTCDDPSLLSCFSEETYELIINPRLDIEGIEDEEMDEAYYKETFENNEPYAITEVIEKNFQDNVTAYSIVDKGISNDSEFKSTNAYYGPFAFYDNSACCIRTYNEQGGLRNNIQFHIYSLSPYAYIRSYMSKDKYGMTWTCNCNYLYGIYVVYYREKNAQFSVTYVYSTSSPTFQDYCY